jgi:hypothetical protein
MARAGITAQKLRHVDVLLIDPWSVLLDRRIGFSVDEPANVLVTNPVSFIGQRLLIHHRRDLRKQAQDVLYIHDTLELFGHALEVLRKEWRDRVQPRLAAKTARNIQRIGEAQFRASSAWPSWIRSWSDDSLAWKHGSSGSRSWARCWLCSRGEDGTAGNSAFDVAVLISADSDLSAPVQAIRTRFPSKRVVLACPPARQPKRLEAVAHACFRIGRKKIQDSQFPDEVTKPDGFVLKRPSEWS